MKINLQTDYQSFALFDWAMGLLALVGLTLGVFGIWLGGWFWIVTAMMAACLGLLAYGIWVEPRRLTVTRYRQGLVSHPRAWIKVVYIADLHAGSNRPQAWYDKVADRVRNIRPDVLLVGGDMVVSDTAYLDKLQGLENIKPAYGKFFILGNHDYLDDPRVIRQQMEAWGFKDISHQTEQLVFQGLPWRLAGLDDAFFGRPASPAQNQTDGPLVMLAHEPDVLLDMHEGQADLILCGHTHGGQVRLPILGRLATPSKLKRHIDLGYKVVNGLPIFVTRGLGEVLCRARLFSPPEIVVLELGI